MHIYMLLLQKLVWGVRFLDGIPINLVLKPLLLLMIALDQAQY